MNDNSISKTMAELLVKENMEVSDELALPKHLQHFENFPIAQSNNVIIDPMVAFKIIKHAREHHPRPVNGQVLGLEIEGTIEITNAFPVPTQYGNEEEATNYQIEMINIMQEVNMESNLVGWYTSSKMQNFMQRSYLDLHVSYQDSSASKAVFLVHDIERTEQGVLSLRAFQISDNYLKLSQKDSLTTKNLIDADLKFSNILEELPVSIKSLSLANVLLKELELGGIETTEKSDTLNYESSLDKVKAEIESDTNVTNDYSGAGELSADFFDVPNPSILAQQPLSNIERTMELMIDRIDDYIQDANSWMYWQRGAAKELGRRQAYVTRKTTENASRVASGLQPLPMESERELDAMFRTQPEPSRLNSMMNISQLYGLSKQTNQVVGPAITRLYASMGLQEQK
ncbi:hypothetical protein BB559_003162 [Furculomyces boomerangus]|uniref:MPN domain-containing protein n=2 Tax=Harpellales TaxID=61421 RepID=A0A2T9YND9_9FUNG|nr:hypothetical protein BB559_003162 [Furculomyces boomerangus]PVZ99861.1 hypothetical protein BB558_004103 [Smittium angustum]